MEDNLKYFYKWKTASNTFVNGGQPEKFCKRHTTTNIFWKFSSIGGNGNSYTNKYWGEWKELYQPLII